MKAIGHFAEGAAAYEAGKFNRKVFKMNARSALIDGAAEASRLRDTARLAMGRQIAGLAGSGFDGASGSALDAVRESAIESELEIMQTRRRSEAAAQGFRLQGQAAYAQGYNAQSAGVINGVNSMIDSMKGYGG